MAYPVSSGTADLSTRQWIPIVYSAVLLVEFYAATVFGAIANTDYEGEISSYGDTVRVRTLPTVSVRDYVKGQNLVYDSPDPSYTDLLIDKGKYFGFAINAVDKKQSDIAFVEKWAAHYAETLKIAIDTDILANVYGSADSDNAGTTAGLISNSINLGTGSSPFALTSDNILNKIVDCGVVLDEQNVPETGRYLVLPAWACGLLKKSDIKDASLTGDGKSVLRNGRVGMIDRFEIYMSNLLAQTSADSAWNAIFGQKSAITFASQFTTKEVITNPNDFGDLLRMLQVYGYKVIKPEALGKLYVSKG